MILHPRQSRLSISLSLSPSPAFFWADVAHILLVVFLVCLRARLRPPPSASLSSRAPHTLEFWRNALSYLVIFRGFYLKTTRIEESSRLLDDGGGADALGISVSLFFFSCYRLLLRPPKPLAAHALDVSQRSATQRGRTRRQFVHTSCGTHHENRNLAKSDLGRHPDPISRGMKAFELTTSVSEIHIRPVLLQNIAINVPC